ncbi:MAG: NAD-dependent epimerase/dehydratase family protein [Candidatus Helarchaeota archaeon]
MIVAITGICSGLGRALIPKLQRDTDITKIIGIDIAEYNGNPEKVEFYKVDVRDFEGIMRALQGVDTLIHLAYIVIPKKLPPLKVIYDINVNGSKTVFRAAIKKRIKKIILLSSQSVYGHVKGCPRVVKEDAPRLGIKTINFYYSHTKALVEEYLDRIEESYPDITVVRFRPPIIAGANFLPNLSMIAPGKGKARFFPAIGNRKLALQLIHQDDLTEALIIAIKQDVQGAFNVASNILPDLASFIEEEYKIKVRRIPIPRFLVRIAISFGRMWVKFQWLQAILYNSLLNTEKIQERLGWKAKCSTEDCIRGIDQYCSLDLANFKNIEPISSKRLQDRPRA